MFDLSTLALLLVFLTFALWVAWGETMLARRWRKIPLDDRDLTRR